MEDITPEIDLAKGLVGARGAAIIQYVQDCHRRRRAKFEEAVLADSNIDTDEISRLITANEALVELLEISWHSAERTASDTKIRLLARVFAQALTDPALIDVSYLRIQTFHELSEQQVHALALLAVPVRKPWLDFNAFRERLVSGPAAHELMQRKIVDSPEAADAIAASFERLGLIYDRAEQGSDFWGFTAYGKSILQVLREVDQPR